MSVQSKFKNKLVSYKNFKISKEDLYDELPQNTKSIKVDELVIVKNIDIINLLENYYTNSITKKDLVCWVNVIWFSDWYDYFDEHSNCISSIMSELEELDEVSDGLTDDAIVKFIRALKKNEEI